MYSVRFAELALRMGLWVKCEPLLLKGSAAWAKPLNKNSVPFSGSPPLAHPWQGAAFLSEISTHGLIDLWVAGVVPPGTGPK